MENNEDKQYLRAPAAAAVGRTIVLTLPTAVVLCLLTISGNVDPLVSLSSYLFILFISLALMNNFMLDLQALVGYAQNLSEGINAPSPRMLDSDTESVEITKAINRLRNIWSEKQREGEITLSDAAILDSLPEPLIFVNDSFVITGANLSARDVLGHNIRDRSILDIISDELFHEKLRKVREHAVESETMEYSLPAPWQKIFSVKIIPLPAQGKGGANILISMGDITLQRTMEQQQTDFFANASHELKTPLSVISGFIETLRTTARDDPEAWEGFLHIIQSQAESMTQLINDLLSLSRLEDSLKTDRDEPVAVVPILEDLMQALQKRASDKGMRFETAVLDRNVAVLSLPYKVKQVLQNLLENAVKYGLEDSAITIEIKNIDNMTVLLRVTNKTKEPIPQQQISSLTQRFFRADNAKADKIPGTGLGLAIVKAIVTGSGGNIEISSNSMEGTTFSILLPSAAQA